MPLIDDIHYVIYGSGKPVFFLHGFPLDGRIWEMEKLSKNLNLFAVVVDLPGFGQSPPLKHNNYQALGTKLFDFMDEFAGRGYGIVAHSFATYSLLTFLMNHQPKYLDKMSFVTSKSKPDKPETIDLRKRMLLDLEGNKRDDFIRWQTQQIKPREVQRLAGEMIEKIPSRVLCEYLVAAIHRVDLTPALQNIMCPVQSVCGEYDDDFLPYQQDFALNCNQSSSVVIASSGHFPMLDNPVDFCQAINQFMQEDQS